MIRKPLVAAVAALLVMFGSSVSSIQAKPSSLVNALFLVTDNAAHTELAVQPVDPVSLQPLADYVPLSLGHHYTAAISPDRGTLAAITWPSEWQTGGILHIIDLTTWNDQITTAIFDHAVTDLSFSADGVTLFWVQPIGAAYDSSQIYAVFHCAVRNCDATTPWVELPTGFWPFQARLLRSGSQLAVFGIPVDTNYLATGTPQVLVIDLNERQPTATITVNGLIAGQRASAPSDSQTPIEYEYNRPGLAWGLDTNLLYIFHPTTPELTVVDLAAGIIARHIDFAGNKTAGYAKFASGTMRLSIVNERDSRLYVSTMQDQVTSQSDEEFTAASLPLGIEMIDTQTMKNVARIPLPVFEMALSPGGHYLFATGMSSVRTQDKDEVSYSGLYILDAASLETVKHVETDNQVVSLQGFSLDSRYAYVSFLGTDGSNSVMHVIDLTTLSMAAERTLPVGYSALLGTVNTIPW